MFVNNFLGLSLFWQIDLIHQIQLVCKNSKKGPKQVNLSEDMSFDFLKMEFMQILICYWHTTYFSDLFGPKLMSRFSKSNLTSQEVNW